MYKWLNSIISVLILGTFLLSSSGLVLNYSQCNCSGKVTIKLYNSQNTQTCSLKAKPNTSCCKMTAVAEKANTPKGKCNLTSSSCCVKEDYYLANDYKIIIPAKFQTEKKNISQAIESSRLAIPGINNIEFDEEYNILEDPLIQSSLIVSYMHDNSIPDKLHA